MNSFGVIKKCSKKPIHRPVIVWFWPAGIFAGLVLAQAWLKPIILERGKDVENRIADVDKFMSTWILDTNSNIQFWEWWAGTFSDWKLYTLINDPRSKYVFEEFIEAWAPSEIAYNAKPHVGTDKLRIMVKKMREKIITLGWEIRFESCMTDLEIIDSKIKSIIINYNGGPVGIETLSLLLGEDKRTLEEVYEPYLVKIGFIKRTQRGRVVTALGYSHLGLQENFEIR